MLRLTWPAVVIGGAFLLLVARWPSLLLRRAFFPVILLVAIVTLAGYRRRQGQRLTQRGKH
jgi:hypothetical protein